MSKFAYRSSACSALVAAAAVVVGYIASAQSALAQSPPGVVPACSIVDASKPAGCEKNMFAVSVSVSVPNGDYAHIDNPPCDGGEKKQLEILLAAVIAKKYPYLAAFAGPIGSLVGKPIAKEVNKNGGDIARLISPYTQPRATCAPLVVVVPVEATIVGKRLYGGDDRNPIGQCFVDKPPCVGSASRFEEPIEVKNDSARTVYTIFKNWSHDRTRQAAMTVFFTMPEGKEPAKIIPNI
jgi:hypothetical protein